MNLIQAPYIPNSLTTVEKRLVFDYYSNPKPLTRVSDFDIWIRQLICNLQDVQISMPGHATFEPTDCLRVHCLRK